MNTHIKNDKHQKVFAIKLKTSSTIQSNKHKKQKFINKVIKFKTPLQIQFYKENI